MSSFLRISRSFKSLRSASTGHRESESVNERRQLSHSTDDTKDGNFTVPGLLSSSATSRNMESGSSSSNASTASPVSPVTPRDEQWDGGARIHGMEHGFMRKIVERAKSRSRSRSRSRGHRRRPELEQNTLKCEDHQGNATSVEAPRLTLRFQSEDEDALRPKIESNYSMSMDLAKPTGPGGDASDSVGVLQDTRKKGGDFDEFLDFLKYDPIAERSVRSLNHAAPAFLHACDCNLKLPRQSVREQDDDDRYGRPSIDLLNSASPDSTEVRSSSAGTSSDLVVPRKALGPRAQAVLELSLLRLLPPGASSMTVPVRFNPRNLARPSSTNKHARMVLYSHGPDARMILCRRAIALKLAAKRLTQQERAEVEGPSCRGPTGEPTRSLLHSRIDSLSSDEEDPFVASLPPLEELLPGSYTSRAVDTMLPVRSDDKRSLRDREKASQLFHADAMERWRRRPRFARTRVSITIDEGEIERASPVQHRSANPSIVTPLVTSVPARERSTSPPELVQSGSFLRPRMTPGTCSPKVTSRFQSLNQQVQRPLSTTRSGSNRLDQRGLSALEALPPPSRRVSFIDDNEGVVEESEQVPLSVLQARARLSQSAGKKVCDPPRPSYVSTMPSSMLASPESRANRVRVRDPDKRKDTGTGWLHSGMAVPVHDSVPPTPRPVQSRDYPAASGHLVVRRTANGTVPIVSQRTMGPGTSDERPAREKCPVHLLDPGMMRERFRGRNMTGLRAVQSGVPALCVSPPEVGRGV